jgi:hypothetical protein
MWRNYHLGNFEVVSYSEDGYCKAFKAETFEVASANDLRDYIHASLKALGKDRLLKQLKQPGEWFVVFRFIMYGKPPRFLTKEELLKERFYDHDLLLRVRQGIPKGANVVVLYGIGGTIDTLILHKDLFKTLVAQEVV